MHEKPERVVRGPDRADLVAPVALRGERRDAEPRRERDDPGERQAACRASADTGERVHGVIVAALADAPRNAAPYQRTATAAADTLARGMRRVVVICVWLALLLLPAAAAGSELPFLSVGAVNAADGLRQVVDAHGREVLLRGVNVDGIVDYWRSDLRTPYPTDPAAYANGACPPDDPTVEGVPVCQFDFAQMHALGYSAIRLNLSWSLLEPQPGRIDSRYLDRIAQIVGWARTAGIYVVLDMHQDAWSKYIYSGPHEICTGPLERTRGYDGAPLWASAHVLPACALNGTRELDAAVQEDFQRLWSDLPAPDGVGLQEHYANVMVALARRFHDDPTVAGYEIINEPSPGYAAGGPDMDATELFPFYGKVVNTVVARVHRFHQLFFVEPDATRNVTDQRAVTTPWSLYSSYRNVVYAPHIYTWVFTADVLTTGKRLLPADGGYRSAIEDAQQLDLPLWVGEFGNNPQDDDTILTNHYTLQDRDLLGGTLWLWKENANDVNQSVFWGVYGPPFGRGTPQPKRIALTSRAFPMFTAGTLESMSYAPARGTFDIRAVSPAVRPGDRSRATVVFLPRARPAVSGARVDVVGRYAYVYPDGGPYRVFSP